MSAQLGLLKPLLFTEMLSLHSGVNLEDKVPRAFRRVH